MDFISGDEKQIDNMIWLSSVMWTNDLYYYLFRYEKNRGKIELKIHGFIDDVKNKSTYR